MNRPTSSGKRAQVSRRSLFDVLRGRTRDASRCVYPPSAGDTMPAASAGTDSIPHAGLSRRSLMRKGGWLGLVATVFGGSAALAQKEAGDQAVSDTFGSFFQQPADGCA